MIFAGHIIETIIYPNSDRNAYESIIKSLTTYSVSFNSYGKKLGNFVVVESNVKAVCNNCTLSFPSVGVVELENCNELIYVSKICNVDINVVYRLCLGSFCGIVMTVKLNYRITCYGEASGNLSGVAELILDLKDNGVLTCTESNVTLGGKHLAIDRGLYNHTVNGDLAGGEIKSCIISNSCRECYLITINYCAVIKRNSYVRCRIGRRSNSRKNSIIYSRAIVKSNIINVECKLCRSGGLYICTNEGRRTGVGSRCIGIHGRKIQISGNVDGHVYPARFGNICLCRRIKILANTAHGREHKVILTATPSLAIFSTVKLRLECKTRSTHRNVNPHTKGGRL